MKKIITMIATALVSLALAISVFAMYGGETLTYNFPSCSLLNVNITNASLGEWTLSPNCTEDSAGNFTCNCTDNWNLNLTPAENSVGTFGITITDYLAGTTSTTTQTTVISYGGGYVPTTCKQEYAVCDQFQNCCAGLTCQNSICVNISTNSSTTTTAVPSTTSTSTTSTTTTTSSSSSPITGLMTFAISPQGISVLLSLVVAVALIIIFYKKRYNKGKPEL